VSKGVSGSPALLSCVCVGKNWQLRGLAREASEKRAVSVVLMASSHCQKLPITGLYGTPANRGCKQGGIGMTASMAVRMEGHAGRAVHFVSYWGATSSAHLQA